MIIYHRYGGELLGPVRFDHIDACAREVCRKFRVEEEMEEHIATLSSLDDILSTLRAELSDFKATISNNQIETTKSGSGDGVSDDTGVASPSSSQATLLSQETPIPSMTVGGKGPDYKSLRESRVVKKVKRLVTARENSIKSVKIALKKMKEHPETQGKPRS